MDTGSQDGGAVTTTAGNEPGATEAGVSATAATEAAGQTEGGATGQPGGQAEAGSAGPKLTTDPLKEALEGTDPGDGQPPADASGKPRVNLTARLAQISAQRRQEKIAARQALQEASQARQQAEAAASDFQALVAKAKNPETRGEAIDELYSRFGISFEAIVDHEAKRDAQLTPEQRAANELDALKKRLEDQERRAADREKQEAERNAQAIRASHIAGIKGEIARQAETYELCARNPDEAADDVIATVTKAWEKAGKPKLEQGEFEEAVQEAIKVVELRLEQRGKDAVKRYMKGQGKTPPAAAPANGAAKTDGAAPAARSPKTSDLPEGFISGQLSDKDEELIRGLIDRTAPADTSARARPRTISSELGGAAPPRSPVNGAMDPRDALREVTQGLVGRNPAA